MGSGKRERAVAHLALVLALTSQVALSGTRRHDVDDSLHLALAAEPQFAAVGRIDTPSILASATLITPTYVLTAAHVGEATGTMTFTAGTSSSQRAWKVTHPNWTGDLAAGWDISLVRLGTLMLDITPASLWSGNEIGLVGTTVGYGKTGTGLTGAIPPAGTKRAGQNVLDADGTAVGGTNRIVVADFDNPANPADNWFGSATPLALEYLAAPGDSGGGTFIETTGGWALVGVTSFVVSHDGSPNSDYGDGMGLTRVSMFTSWINDVLGTTYEMRWTGASGSFNTASLWQTTFGGQTVNAVPGAIDRVLLDSTSQYTIALPAANLSNDRLTMAAGTATLDLAGRTYSLTNPSAGTASLHVGSAAGRQQLTIVNGTLSTANTWIATHTDARGTVNVSGAAARWNNSSSVYVGGSATASGGGGLLGVAGEASMNVGGTLKVWGTGKVALAGGTLHAGFLDTLGTLGMQLRGLGGWDQVAVTSTASVAGLLDLDVVGRPREGDVLAMITAAGFSGNFASILSNVTTGLPGGTAAFTGGASGTSYEVVFHGWTSGDANGDHWVDGGDLAMLGGNWSLSGKVWADADFNGDGLVDGADLALLGGNWLWTLPPAPPVSLPEPAALLLLSLGGLLIRRRRRAG